MPLLRFVDMATDVDWLTGALALALKVLDQHGELGTSAYFAVAGKKAEFLKA